MINTLSIERETKSWAGDIFKFAEIDNKGTSKLYNDVRIAEKGNKLKDILNGDSISKCYLQSV